MKTNRYIIAAKTYAPHIIIGVLIVSLAGSVVWAMRATDRADMLANQPATTNRGAEDVATNLADRGIVPLTAAQASNDSATAAALTYLIEEEKLAHDVYQTMYNLWGARVFDNIQNSETTHGNLVLAVMESRGMSDPRSQEIGVFNSPVLQDSYNKLVAEGRQSVADAYKAGITIEELDINDLDKMIAALDAKDTDVKAVLDSLLQGSQNHLRAFSRQSVR